MNTIDFDDTVEFVWEWVAQFNTCLAQNNWKTDKTRGLSDFVMNEIADHLFKMVLKAQHPQRVMRALDIHLQSLIKTNRTPALPDVYTEIKIDKDGQKKYLWNTNNFCTILEEGVSRIVSQFEAFHTLGEQNFATAVKLKSTV